MNKYLAAMAAAGSVVIGAEASGAVSILPNQSFTMEANGVGSNPISETAEFSFSVYNLGWTQDWRNLPASERRPVFDRLRLTESDVGRTIFVPASQIPGAVELLTNGENNFVFWQMSVGNGAGFMEFPFLFGAAPITGPRDFAGHEVTHIGLRVNELELNDPVVGRYDYSLNLVIIPEPAGLALVALGGLALLRRRRACP